MPVNLPTSTENVNPAEPQAGVNKINLFLQKLTSVPLAEKLFFIQHLGIMLKAGISLSTALKTLAKQTTNKRFARIIADISRNVEKGVSFTESLKPHEKIFGQLFINMIESGEISGKLEEVLKRLYIQFNKSEGRPDLSDCHLNRYERHRHFYDDCRGAENHRHV